MYPRFNVELVATLDAKQLRVSRTEKTSQTQY